jgi:hypothetical protein
MGIHPRAHPELLDGGDTTFIASTLDEWLRAAGRGDTVVLYWTGHATFTAGGFYLITKNSPQGSDVNMFNAIKSSTLGSALAKSRAEKLLVLLDTSYSGAGAQDIVSSLATELATRPQQPGQRTAYAVIASAHPLRKAQEAVFCKALTKVLSQPLAIGRRWTDYDQFIQASDLAEAVERELDEHVYCEMYGSGQRFIPNPRYRGEVPAEDVETKRLSG